MREILFRGKRLDNGEWVEGYYACIGGLIHVIFTGKLDLTTIRTEGGIRWEWFEVDPETVGQYTEKSDKNDKKVFEGDIVHFRKIHYEDGIEEGIGYAKFVGSGWFLESYYELGYVFTDTDESEVIGNIHDNPEMIGGSKE